MLRSLLVLLVLLAAAASAQAAPAEPARSEAPIGQVTLSNGALRYFVPLKVGATALLASLDPGSTGLRILPGVLGPGDARSADEPETYGYASGSRYEGVVGEAVVTLGGA